MDDATRAIVALARGVLGELDADAALSRVLAAAREITGARYAALGVLDESRSELARFDSLGLDDAAQRRIGARPRGRGVLGELIRHAVPLRLADVSADPRSYGFPDGHPRMTSFLGAPILVAGEPFGSLYLADKEGADEFSEQDEAVVVMLADLAGVALDTARRYARSEAQRTELEHTVEALDATIQIGRALGGQTDTAAILELVTERGRALVSARALVIEVAQDGELTVAAGAGELPAGLIGARLPLADTVASAALRSRETQRLSDPATRERFDRHGLGHLGVAADDALVVPLMFRNEAYGVLVAVDRVDGVPFDLDHQLLLESFAASVAGALATARSAALERRRQSLRATEAERSRWARELHDETLQGLAHLRLLLAGAQRIGTEDAMAAAIEQAGDQLELDIAGLRSLISDLRPAALDELGTEAAIRALADRVERAGLAVAVDIDLAYESGRATARHVPELETAIYRIVQEALTNAAKHGHAQHAQLEIAEDESTVRITVRDDGGGFDPASRTGGFGLLGMAERAELLEGCLSVESAPGAPTTITAALPAQQRTPDDDRAPAG
jgi:signal transduction histidine kinase